MSSIEEWKAKRKRALIAICTIGLSQTNLLELYQNAKETENGMSFRGGFVGFTFRLIWFTFTVLLFCIPIMVINIFKFINYQISISSYNKEHNKR